MMGSPDQLALFDIPIHSPRIVAAHLNRSGTFIDNMKLPAHRWYRYSAGFSAQWAEQLIREFDPITVLDPFAGSGTTLLAAEAAGVMAYGYESHPFVMRIAQAKTHWNVIENDFIKAAQSLLSHAIHNTNNDKEEKPDLLTKCYTPEALYRLDSLRNSYLLHSADFAPEVADLLWLAITAILRSCSFAGTAQWQYILPNKRKSTSLDPFLAFEQKITDIADDIRALRNAGYRSNAITLLHDARALPTEIPANSIDLVVTSPPYPNNYDYADATRLEMTFWGEIRGWGDLQNAVRQYIIRSCSQHATAERLQLDTLLADPAISAIRPELTGVCQELAIVRQTKGGKKAYHTMIAAYFCDLARVFHALRPLCRKGSTLCFVIGDSAPYGVYVPADEWLGKLALAAGFSSYSFEKLRDRNIKWKNRKHTVPLFEGRLWIKG